MKSKQQLAELIAKTEHDRSSVAIIADRIAKCGYDIYLTLRELEQENRKLKWENKDLKEEHTALLKHLKLLRVPSYRCRP